MRHMAWEVKNLEEAAKRLEANNVKVIEECEIPGRMRFSFHDPFGNRTELLQMIDQ